MTFLDQKTLVITGGTGSLGKVLVRRLLSGECGRPRKIIVFSRDEAKQYSMRLQLENRRRATDDALYDNFRRLLEFRIGDIRDYHSVCGALKNADVVVNAAALKQVPACEYFPFEAVQTNVGGAENLVRAIRESCPQVQAVVGVSTDKACKPISVMGMTKALQERIFVSANLTVPETRFIGVRYGNVLASRGSVIPLFLDQIRSGGPVTLTTPEMTRFLMTLQHAVDTILAALETAAPGELFVPFAPAARIPDVAAALIGSRTIETVYNGIRPGEKVHEELVSAEEAGRTFRRGDYLVVRPMLPELLQYPLQDAEPTAPEIPLEREYSSADALLDRQQVVELLQRHQLMVDGPDEELEVLR